MDSPGKANSVFLNSLLNFLMHHLLKWTWNLGPELPSSPFPNRGQLRAAADHIQALPRLTPGTVTANQQKEFEEPKDMAAAGCECRSGVG